MAEIKISTVIPEDRRLVIDLPSNAPLGRVIVTINYVTVDLPENATPLEIARAKFAMAGILPMQFPVRDDISREDLDRSPIELPKGSRPSEELIDEDRGEY